MADEVLKYIKDNKRDLAPPTAINISYPYVNDNNLFDNDALKCAQYLSTTIL